MDRHHTLRGVAWILAYCAALSGVSACSRALGPGVDAWQLSFVRAAVGVAVMVPLLLRVGRAGVSTRHPRLHLSRAAILTAAMYCGFHGFTHLPLADATGLYFSRPLFLVLLAAVWLGQPMGWRRWASVAIGFAGMWLVIRPGGQGWHPDSWVPATGALLIAVALLQVKRMQATESDLAIVFYSNVFGALLASVPAAWHWQAVEGSQAVLLLGAGVLGVVSQACMVKAYRAADPATLAPVEYLQIPFTVVLAALLFSEWPHPWTGAGIVLIVIAGWQASRSLVSRHA